MQNDIDRRCVLILNKNWVPINTTTPKDSFSMMYCDHARGVLIEDNSITPLKWNDWINLKLKDQDRKIKTVRGYYKIPSVIVLTRYDKIPKQMASFTQKNLWYRDNFTCQYTGKKLTKLTGNIDHVIPKSRGGKTSWENCVLAHKSINAIKADKSLEEVGLKLFKTPSPPKIMPVSFFIKNDDRINDWNLFLKNEE